MNSFRMPAVLILASVLFLAACGPLPTPMIPTDTPAEVLPTQGVAFPPVSTETVAPTYTPTLRAGRPAGNVQSFSVIDNYDPSGILGDVGDVTVAKKVNSVEFTLETQAREPHEWDWKYVDCVLNPNPAYFGGVMFLDPPSNWGNYPGRDLRGFKTIKWESRSLGGNIYAEFLIGGVLWQWKLDDKTNCWTKMPVPYSDSMPRISLGIKQLTSQSQSFQYDLSDLPEEYFRNVVGGFGWTISWSANGVDINDRSTPPGPVQSKTIVIEVSSIRYEK